MANVTKHEIQKVETLATYPDADPSGRVWIRTMRTEYTTGDGTPRRWWWVSRNGERGVRPDAVMIVALVKPKPNSLKYKLLVTDEYRVPLEAREYGFPAGLIEPGDANLEDRVAAELHEETGLDVVRIHHELTSKVNVVSSAGLSNESVSVVFVEAEGKLTKKYLDSGEDINASLLSFNQAMALLETPGLNFSAKAWGILCGWRLAGKFTFGPVRRGSPRPNNRPRKPQPALASEAQGS